MDTKNILQIIQDNDTFLICFVYWDLDATPNDNGNQWRMATDPMRVRI